MSTSCKSRSTRPAGTTTTTTHYSRRVPKVQTYFHSATQIQGDETAGVSLVLDRRATLASLKTTLQSIFGDLVPAAAIRFHVMKV